MSSLGFVWILLKSCVCPPNFGYANSFPFSSTAERRAQLARSRSRQNLLQLDSSTVKEINFDESHANEIPNQPPEKSQEPERKERRQHRRREKTQEESEAEKLLARLKEL